MTGAKQIARSDAAGFDDIVRLIDAARMQAYQAVNTTLIELYWQVGTYITAKLEAAEWGDGVVSSWPVTSPPPSPGLKDSRGSTYFACASFTKPTGMTTLLQR